MTLNTNIAIKGSVDPEAVFTQMRLLLGATDAVPIERTKTGIKHPPFQGLAAWLWLKHNNGDPLLQTEWEDEEEKEYFLSSPLHNGYAHIVVDLDTGYAYSGPTGESCSGLHARLIAQLGVWLKERGCTWMWQNEYTGDWSVEFEGLAEFAGFHADGGAAEWFSHVLTAIGVQDA